MIFILCLWDLNLYDVASLNYGFTHTNQDRDAKRTLWIGQTAVITQPVTMRKLVNSFLEGVYSIECSQYQLNLYAGFSWLRVSTG